MQTKLNKYLKVSLLSIVLVGGVIFFIVKLTSKNTESLNIDTVQLTSEEVNLHNSLLTKTDFADRFDYPVGWPDADDYHDLQSFQENNHLGEDWNDRGGCDDDLGKPVFAIADGYIISAKNHQGGWGNVVRIVHKYLENNEARLVESLYAHLSEIKIKEGQNIKAGEQIGTIGNVDGLYCAHLHLELRTRLEMPLGGGYSSDIRGFISPSEFIKKNRKLSTH